MMILPELCLLLLSVLFLLISVSGKKTGNISTYARWLSLLVLLASALSFTQSGTLFSGAYRIDLFSQIFKALLAIGFCLVIFMLDRPAEIVEEFRPEYYMFLSFSALGLMMLSSAMELITLVISLEISSYSLYVIVPLRKDQTRIQLEASMKYLFFGAASTGIMLYGMSFLYGISHSTFLADIIVALPKYLNQPMIVFALTLTLAGFFFKLSLFPMHFWAPDIYEGASNGTTTFIATVPKVAATAVLIRIAMLAALSSSDFVRILIVLSALSMTFGNLVGLVQKDVKRLLAYSGIAHSGYLLMGVLTLTKEGNASAIYYMAVYLFMNLGCFYVIMLLSASGKNVKLNDLSGLSRRAPLLGFTLAVSAFSLAGIPPTGGFTGKLFLFTNAFAQGHLTLVIIGAVNTVISIFYYLNLVRMSYSKEAPVAEPLTLSFHQKTVCLIYIVVILYLGIMPSGLMEILKTSVTF
jgi:NADH-quinone oxidoreductase subunit N